MNIRKQKHVISDTDLYHWMLENGFFSHNETPHRTYEEVCQWMMQRIRNKKNAVKWVYNTIKIQELKNRVQNIEDLNKYIKPFTDELTHIERLKDSISNNIPINICLDGILLARINALNAIMSERINGGGAWLEYVHGLPSKP